jgi:OOP family OmpA-OmpF porin
MIRVTKRWTALCTMILSLLFSCLLVAAEVSDALFKDANPARAAAQAVNAAILAPVSWEKGQKAYDTAEKQVKSGSNLERIRKNLATATTEFDKATRASAVTEVSFADTLKARDAAAVANASELAKDEWSTAENEFNKATRKLEDGSVKSATSIASSATGLYRTAELAGVKNGILGQAWKLINQAEDEKIDRWAPTTFAKARSLASEADKELSNNRYETGRPLELAAQAQYEAEHGFSIAKIAQATNKKETTVEAIILSWETPVIEVANTLGISADLRDGYQQTSDTSVSLIADLLASNEAMKGNQKEAQESERLRTQLAEVEALFAPNEARILREGRDLIIRLVGLTFQPGRANIETQYFNLLGQVQTALGIFPDNSIVIEGHTDSTGSEKLNLSLSQERAQAVEEYLIASLGMAPARIQSVGYGKNRPIGNNETAEGRASNRRIDVIIRNARASEL